VGVGGQDGGTNKSRLSTCSGLLGRDLLLTLLKLSLKLMGIREVPGMFARSRGHKQLNRAMPISRSKALDMEVWKRDQSRQRQTGKKPLTGMGRGQPMCAEQTMPLSPRFR